MMAQLLGRIGTAFRILIGAEPTWWGIQKEWAEIKVEAADLFQKHNALAARLIKAQKKLAREREEDCGCEEQHALPADPKARKAALRAQVFGGRARNPAPVPNGSGAASTPRWVPDTEESDE